MTEKEILEGNKLIAEFMELPFKNREWDERGVFLWSDNYWRIPEKLKYHSSWDWLMPVVEKIESMGFDSRICGHNSDNGYLCDFVDIGNNEASCNISFLSKIDAVYYSVLDFIKLHNEIKLI